MSELREVADAIVTEGRKAGLCPSSFGCDYCEHFGCPRLMAEMVDADDNWDMSIQADGDAIRYFMVRRA